MSILTLTGIDAKTSSSWIKEMERKYVTRSGFSGVEFAILRSPKVGQSPRYPTREEINRITNYVYPHQLAFHLCGRYAEMVFTDQLAELCDIVDFNLVSRVQVNSRESGADAMLKLIRFGIHIGKPVVMQLREGPFPYVPKLDLLQDRSGGRGLVETTWFKPDAICQKAGGRIGYAGGLNPENIAAALPEIRKAAKTNPFWIDCETGVRTDDWFDTDKAEAMMAALWKPSENTAA